MNIYRTNNPLEFDDVDGIIIDESAPPSSIQGVAANTAILVGRFQRGPVGELIEPGSIGNFLEVFGKSDKSGNKELKNKRFGRLRVIRAAASDAAKATLTVDGKLKIDAKYPGVYGNNIKVTVEDAGEDIPGTPGVAATFAGTPAGASSVVGIEADNPGVAGNVTLTGDGVDDVDDLVAAFNAANVGNELSVTAGGAEVPDNGENIVLAGGVDAIPGVDAGVKLTIKDDNADAVLPAEVYDNLKIAEITSATFVNSQLVDVTVLSTTAEPATQAEAPLAGGSDGTEADTDYQTAIAVAEQVSAGNVLWTDKYNAAIKGYLRTHVLNAPDKMVIVSTDNPEDNIATALADVQNYRDAEGRIIYAFNGLQTRINGVNEWTSAASWVASIFSNVAPNVSLAYSPNIQYTLGATDVRHKLTRNQYIQLKEAGIAGFELERDLGGIKLVSAIVTQIINSSKITILRRRMADFLTDSIALNLKNYQNAPNTLANRTEVKGSIVAFDDGLINTGVLPSDAEVNEGKARLIDTEVLNTDASIAQGFFKILYKRRIYSEMRYIVLQAQIGESVIVTEGE